MKTAKLTSILIFLLFAIALPALTYATTIGKITALQGDVDVLRPGMERAAPAALQQPVSEGDIVRTKSTGKAEITFVDESVVRLAPNSRLQITEYLMEGNKRKRGVMNLFRGKLRAVVSKSRGFLAAAFGETEKFEVRTPTAVAGVRGTDFFVSYSMGVTGIMVKEGRVDAFNPAMSGQVVLVTEGNATFIAENKPPSPPRPANDVEMIRYTRDTDVSEKPKEGEGTITADAGTLPPAGETFGYEAPEGIAPPATNTGAVIETVEIPSSESHPELLSDIFAPVITTSGPPPYTNLSTAAFTVTFNEPVTATYTMGTWGTTSTATTSDTFSIASLPEGSYTLTVTATDAAGNVSTQTYTWTTDYTPPTMTGVSGPTALTNSSSAAFGFTANEAVSSYSYSLDGGVTWVSTGSSLNLSAVPEGANTIKVRVTDLAGNTSVASLPYSWTTDYTAPASLALTGTPAAITNINTATIVATATDANGVTYSYTLDGAASNGTLTGLTEGVHTFVATATDGANNTSTTSYSWLTDYTLPTGTITPVSASLYKGGPNIEVSIGLSSTEPSTYEYSLDGGATWTSTGASLILPPRLEGNYTLDVRATDTATNISPTTSLLFDLSYYTLNGQTALTVSGVQDIGIASGKVIGVSNASWGSYSLTLSGSWWEGGSSTYTLVAGGTSTDATASNNGGYWLETITNAKSTTTGSGTFTGTSNFLYLSYDRLGTGTGTVNGSYSSGWSATDSGTYIETPLAWSGKIVPDGNTSSTYNVITSAGLYSTTAYNNINNLLDIAGNSTGLMGVAYDPKINPWSQTTSVSYMGIYSTTNGNGYGPPYLWTPEIYSYNPTDLTNTTNGGAYRGFIGGVWNADGTINAKGYSLYIDPSGNAGILKGGLKGAYYPQLNMFGADGTWTPIQMEVAANVKVLPVGLYAQANPSTSHDNVYSYFGNGFGSSLTGNITIANNNSLTYDTLKYSVAGQKWGIQERILGGSYCYPDCLSQTTPPDTWYITQSQLLPQKYETYYTEGTQWSKNQILGTTYGYGADITNTPMTWISVGETIGTFNPADSTWQAVQTGAWLDTNKFLGMIAAGDTAKLAALNIPFAEVGKATLSGSGSGFTVNMTDTTFFAYSNGAAPKIWATGNVNGSYSVTPSGTANLTGSIGSNTLSADFNVNTWDATNSKWMATVTNGNIPKDTMNNTTSLTFEGAAAGKIDQDIKGNACANCFSGTAAGTAQ